ncbi:hypothetical protein JZ751_025260 [Albula glossodonta]|uniref:Trinucleotide repeat containing adaptor 6B n=1 Tax=Albula glossodonta TaxID=121402 RepID=A0A8T2NE81_9TELE|nr:hypothetical protein JZ751_025260 [Albula glossodonta]
MVSYSLSPAVSLHLFLSLSICFRKAYQEREQQFMEDKKRKKEEKRKREASQKVAEQKNKVPELTKPTSTQSPVTPSSASPNPGPAPSSSPSPATAAAGVPPQGGNNAKRPAVANGQPPSGAQAPQRYMPREVPPRFRCQQDHKVLLKRGQPPLSCMLLGGGNGGGGTPLSQGDAPSASMASASDSSPGSLGPAAPPLPHSSSSSVAASSTTTSSNYANSTWGASSGSQPLSQGWEKVIVDGSDLEEWPSIAGGTGAGDGVGGTLSSSASWSDRQLQQQKGAGTGVGKGAGSGSPSPPSSSCSPNECTQPGSGVWGSSSSQAGGGGGNLAVGSAPSKSKAPPLPGTLDSSVIGGSSGIPGANFSPNANPSAWPALVQDGTGVGAAAEGAPTPLPNLSPLSANPPLNHPPPSANPAGHQHQLHQMQAREREHLCGEWGGAAPESGTGPKKAEEESECGMTGGGDPPASSSSPSSTASSSSWRGQPSFSTEPKTGASRTDPWDGVAREGEGGNSWGYSGQEAKGAGSKGWGAGSGGGCKTPGVSQGAWGGGGGAELSVGEWGKSTGGAVGVAGPNNPGGAGGCSSSSGSSEGSNPPASSSPTSSSMTRAWDNQKGAGETGEWGGQGGRGGGGASSSSVSGHSRAGSGGAHNQHHSHHRSHPPSNPEAALQNLLSRTDLDPRVLSNTGWGQTQIRQNVAWDLDGGGSGSSAGTKSTSQGPQYSTAANPATTDTSAPSSLPGTAPSGSLNSSATLATGAVCPGEGWESGSSSSSSNGSASLQARGPPPSHSNVRSSGAPQPGGGQGKSSGGWGRSSPMESQGKGWGSEGQDWRENRGGGGGGGGWGDFGQQGTPAGGGGGSGWGAGAQVRNWGLGGGKRKWSRGWRFGSGNVGQLGRGGTEERLGWGRWGVAEKERSKSHQGWGSKGHQAQIPNSQTAMMKAPAQQQQSQPQQPQPQPQPLDSGPMQGGWGKPSGPMSQNQNQSSGWASGPIPRTAGGPTDGAEPSGWEEPSPQSISRKMEIDDGTSAWGDPSHYNYKSVNLWDKNGAPAGQPQSLHTQTQPQTQQQQGPGPAQQQQPPGRPAHQHAAPGNRDMNPGHMPNKASGMVWGGGGTPSSPSVDNGTAAWGKPTDAHTGWGDPEDSGKASGWGNLSPNPIKSGSKSMQEGWGEGEGSVSASRHSSWEEEEEGAGVWSSTGSQGSSSSYNSGGWGQGHGGKKGNSKGALKGGGVDSWMNPMTRQFSNMGLLGEDPSGRPLDLAPGPPQDKKMEGEKRGMTLSDYNGEIRKGGRGGASAGGGGGGTVFRSPSSKEAGPGESGPYYDKTGGHNVFGGSGGMAQSRGVHQPGVPPINPSPGIRAQVPHQFLSPQLPSSVLKQMPPPSSSVGGVGGVAGGVFPPQLSPQHIAMLSSIYPPHIQFQLACQLLLQQPQQQQQQQQQQQLLQNQRKFPQNIRQQPDPQQQRQQQQGGGTGGGSKLSPSHLGGVAPKPSMADPLSHPGLGGALADLHSKTPGGYSGFSSGVNLPGLEIGSMVGGPGGMKDGGGQQSRFKWIMEGHSPAPSPPDSALHKNGPISAPVKLRGGSPYSQYEMLGNEGLGVPPQGPADNWHRTPGNKMGTKTGSSSWPPEFQPGVPWKGIQSADPESDPYMTPGSVLGSSGTSSLNDTEHQLLRDNTESNPSLNTLLPSPGAWPYSASDSPLTNAHNSAKYTEYKPSWPPDPIGHNKPWKTNRNSSQMPRPPPGLTHQKQPSLSSWGGGGPRLSRGWGGSSASQETRYGPDKGDESWIDGSTLRTICLQHGPLLTFHLGLTQGSALIRYSSRQEAAKAQSALHMCVLGNTTILAEFVSEEEVARYFAHSQAGGSGSGSGGGTVPGAGGGQGPSGTGAVGASGGGSTPGSERERASGSAGVAGGTAAASGNNNGAGASVGSVGASGSGWQSLDSTGSSPDPSSAQGPGLSIFAQWSSNGAGGGVGGGTGGVEPGRQGLWGAMTPGYPSSSLWGAPTMEDRHQMGSPAALLPGDLLGGGTDSI